MFIIFDSIDGAGKGRQRIEVSDYVANNSSLKVHGIEFPVHNVFYESVVHPALQEETKLNGPSWVLSFLLDKTLQTELLNEYVGQSDNLLIADGYFTTTIAYQSFLSGQVPLEKLLEYAKDFEIPTPDFAIFIDADPEVAIARKQKEEGHDEGLDMNEKSLEKQKKLQTIFKKMAAESIYCPWEMVDGNGTIEEVKENLLNVLRNKKII